MVILQLLSYKEPKTLNLKKKRVDCSLDRNINSFNVLMCHLTNYPFQGTKWSSSGQAELTAATFYL